MAASAARTAMDAPSDQSLRVPCYCEENVWRLAYRKTRSEFNNNDYYVAFVTNPQQCTPMFQQLASSNPSQPCFWDYHVILLQMNRSVVHVLDIDSRLPYPCDLETYLEGAFPGAESWSKQYLPYFRLIRADVYLQTFGSDRLHMFNTKTKTWIAEPPPYDCIMHTGRSNLARLMAVDETDIQQRAAQQFEVDSAGAVYSLKQLRRRLVVE